MKSPAPSTRGFTLLEIVVALGILGLGLAASMQIFSSGLKNVHRIDMAHQAMEHGQRLMNEILSDEDIRNPVRLSGYLDENFSYTAVVDHWQEPQSQLSIEATGLETYLLSVLVDIHFVHDRYGKLYRLASLKAVSPQPGPPQATPDPSEAIRQLFGGGPR